MNTKAAIKKLPTLDKRWSLHCGIASFNYGKPGQWDIDADNCTDPMSLVAAAKTLGYEIWWEPTLWRGSCGLELDKKSPYRACWCRPAQEGYKQDTVDGKFKSPAAAIAAAFCAVVKAKGE